MPPKKRILIVNCYFPERREPMQLVNEIPNALAPILLAGGFRRERCDVRLYNEVTHGFLEMYAPELLKWPDLVVFTGLTATFDRMLQLSAYLRTLNPTVIIAAGGLAIRAFPTYAKRFFDYVCLGDVEEIREVIADALGPEYSADTMIPRYDLADWVGRRVGYAESSRNCNFRCTYCSLTAVGRGYAAGSLDDLKRQIVAMGKREVICFQDNQFYGPNRQFFLDRMALLRDLRRAGYFKYWHASVTVDFLWKDENLDLAREAGCFSLFIGVESFDETWLRRVNKTQNSRYSQVDMIQRCLEAGILFQYGLVFDPTERTLAEMHCELDLICDNAKIPAPNFIFMAIPFPATPFFRDRFAQQLILPNTKVRDLEGSTLSLRPLDPIDEVAEFIATAKNLRGYRWRHLRRQASFLARYRKSLGRAQSLLSTAISLSIVAPAAVSNPAMLLRRRQARTHVSSTERLDCVYQPFMRVATQFSQYFQPTKITDADGALSEALAADLVAIPRTPAMPEPRHESAIPAPALRRSG
jgi:hopanoid C-2 methylase